MTKFRVVGSALLCLVAAGSTSAFAPNSRAFVSRTSTTDASSSTSLYISSWGKAGNPAKQMSDEKRNPEEDVQAYLKAPEPVEARVNIDGAVLVSGLVKTTERTDQFIFDLLNHEESAFEFDKIVAFVDDEKFAKKRLLSRSARYTGLLDKLDFSEASAAGAMPTAEQLEGVKSWVAVLEGDSMIDQCKEIASIAKGASSVENVCVLLTGAVGLDASACQAAVDAFKTDDNTSYTIMAVGKLEEHAEGRIPYKFTEFGSAEGVLPDDAIFSREEAMRMITEGLQLECGVNQALTISEVYEKNATEAKLIKGLRQAGYARPQEIDHMLRVGIEDYEKAIEEFKTKNPDHAKGYYTTDAWWEDPKFQKSVKESSLRREQAIQKVKDERTEQIEEIAKEWAKREYFKQSMAGTVEDDMTEEAFTESVWDRAMFEADLKYRQSKGEVTDDEAELADFKKQQERKKEAMLKRAKEEMKELLEGDDLLDDDLVNKLETMKAEDDNTEDDE